MLLSERSSEKELIDLGFPYYSKKEYQECLCQLDKIGRYLGGDKATFKGFGKLKRAPKTILDVGCGGGLFTLKLGKKYPQATVLGIDTSSEAIQIANYNLSKNKKKSSNVRFSVPASPHLSYPAKSFDVITSTLVCHHLNDQELIEFLKSSFQIAKQAIILNDLHRHFFASICYAIITPLFFRNRLIIHDGLVSIKRGFLYKDWINYLSAAGIPLSKCVIRWHWAFRWMVFIDTSKE
jgi:2-polyprenyl-3-methyl-5-hydroxy-6-metoxy-1,4-benzoquinol methylase